MRKARVIVKKENFFLVVGCDSKTHQSKRRRTKCNNRWEDLVVFLNSSNLEIINQGNEFTFCIGDSLVSFRLLESIIDWEVSSEPSMSDHRHSVHYRAP
jgi:hypothetical protein